MLSIAVINLSLFHIYAYPNHLEQESEFAVYLKTGAGVGVGVKLLGAGVDSESKILDSNHLCSIVRQIGTDEKLCESNGRQRKWILVSSKQVISENAIQNRILVFL